MKTKLHIAIVLFLLTAISARSSAQSEPSPRLKRLSAAMQEIQTRAQKQARIDPDAFKFIAAGIADQHRDDIILGASSQDGIERRLAATLLGMASPLGQRTTALVALASDEVPRCKVCCASGNLHRDRRH